ncbi:hypothetical protein ACIHFE_30275 [Streptomyces sp. NPDC052396]|uniref:hypothetical protein n=1 Tax=Streptomyces sp. NPDC052396 TaxID=3365689 RepID=UPI0037CF9708
MSKSVLKGGIARIAAVAVTASTLAMTMVTSASASPQDSGDIVSWKNDATHACLNWIDHRGNSRPEAGACFQANSTDFSQWRETSVDGQYWTFRPAGGDAANMCLTSYNTTVYLENCQDGNWWQQWEEIRTDAGWKLKHRGDGWVRGYYLDTDGVRMYTEPENNGKYQVWH